MKLHWGHYIAISFTAFVLLILYMVYRSYQHDNELVSEDYYAQEIEFQSIIDKKANAATLEIDISWKSVDGGILVTYPAMENKISGEISLMRPSDKSKDLKAEINVNADNRQFLKDESFIPGKYLIYFDWKSGSEEYYTDGTAYIIQ